MGFISIALMFADEIIHPLLARASGPVQIRCAPAEEDEFCLLVLAVDNGAKGVIEVHAGDFL